MDINAFFNDLKNRLLNKKDEEEEDEAASENGEDGAEETGEDTIESTDDAKTAPEPSQVQQLATKAQQAFAQFKQTTRDLLARFQKKKTDEADESDESAESANTDDAPDGQEDHTEQVVDGDASTAIDQSAETVAADGTPESSPEEATKAADDIQDAQETENLSEDQNQNQNETDEETSDDEADDEADDAADDAADDEDGDKTATVLDKTKALLLKVKTSRRHQLILFGGCAIFIGVLFFPFGEKTPEEGTPTPEVAAAAPAETPSPAPEPTLTATPEAAVAAEATVTPEPTAPAPTATSEESSPTAAPTEAATDTPTPGPTEEVPAAPAETPVPTFTPTTTPILPVANNDVQEGEAVPEATMASESGNVGSAEEGAAGEAPLADVILQMKEKLQEYLAPEDPLYEITGRGLVYNCVGQHWACVDREVYFKCQEVAQWAKDHQQKIRCVPANVYVSTEDCTTIQIYNINKLIRPDECPRP